jgi:hypothetical protein
LKVLRDRLLGKVLISGLVRAFFFGVFQDRDLCVGLGTLRDQVLERGSFKNWGGVSNGNYVIFSHVDACIYRLSRSSPLLINRVIPRKSDNIRNNRPQSKVECFISKTSSIGILFACPFSTE